MLTFRKFRIPITSIILASFLLFSGLSIHVSGENLQSSNDLVKLIQSQPRSKEFLIPNADRAHALSNVPVIKIFSFSCGFNESSGNFFPVSLKSLLPEQQSAAGSLILYRICKLQI
jgi:hypothetical protein